MRKPVMNEKGLYIGAIDHQENHETTAWDSRGLYLGTYHEDVDVTKDTKGNYVGHGDRTMALIYEAWNKNPRY